MSYKKEFIFLPFDKTRKVYKSTHKRKKYTSIQLDFIDSGYKLKTDGSAYNKFKEFYNAYTKIKLFWENKYNGVVSHLSPWPCEKLLTTLTLDFLTVDLVFFEKEIKKLLKHNYNFQKEDFGLQKSTLKY